MSRPYTRALWLSLCIAPPLWAQSSAPNHTAMWWNPAEAGWGLNIAHQGDVLFPMWFTYNAQGQIQWYSVNGAAKQADGSYTGEVFRFAGKPFNQISGSQAFTGSTPVGNARLSFSGTDALSFNYTVDGITQSKSLNRFNFGTAPTCTFTGGSRVSASNYTDIWWNPAESGWGLTLAHQGDAIFGLWYTYDSAGRAMWVSALANKQADGSYSGDLNRANLGTAFSQINGSGATSFPLPKVGTATLRFSDGENGSFSYTLDGITQTKAISRFVFGGPVSVCAAASNGGGGNPNAGASADCFRNLLAGDSRAYRNTSTVTGAPIPIPPTVFTETERIVNGTFGGESLKVIERFDSNGRLQSRDYYRTTASKIEHVAVESLDVNTGAIKGVTRFNPTLEFPLDLQVGQSVSYTTTATITDTALGTLTRQVVQTYKLVGRETVSVPAGTFANACKLETRETVTAPEATSNSTALLWTSSAAGNLKVQFSANAAGANINTEIVLTSFTAGN